MPVLGGWRQIRIAVAGLGVLCAMGHASAQEEQAAADGGAEVLAADGGAEVQSEAPAALTDGADGGTQLQVQNPIAATQSSDVADLSLEDLLNQDIRTQTVTAVSRRAETVGEAPATVTVISRDDFVRHAWRNVAESLWSVPGMYVSWGRDYAYTGVRGISFPRDVDTRVLVLLDGHTLNNAWSASSNTTELLSLPPEAIERVEVIRGPSSSIYGSNAFFGVVNIVSRRPSAKEPHHTQIGVGASSLNLYRAVASAQHRIGDDADVSAYAIALTGNGPAVKFEDMTRPRQDLGGATPTDGVTRNTDYERGVNVGALASFKGLSLQLSYVDRWKGLPSAPADSIFNDPYNSVTDVQAFAEARYERKLGEHSVQFRAWLNRFQHRQFLHRDPTDWPTDSWVHPDPHTVSEGNDDAAGAELQFSLQLAASDQLVAGAELQHHSVTQPTYELDPTTGKADPTTVAGGLRDSSGNVAGTELLNAAVYLQNDWRPLPNLGVVAGLRFDHNSIFSRYGSTADVLGALTPRVALIYTPVEAATLKLTYGEAFRNPSVYEAFFDDRASVCGNPDVRPERQRTGELAAVIRAGRGVNVSASAYAMRLDGLLVTEAVASCYTGSGPRTRFTNGGEITVVGGEAGLDLRLSMLTAYVSTGVNSAQQDVGGQSGRPPNSPAIVASAGIAVPLIAERLFVSMRAHGLSSRLDWTRDETSAVPGYFQGELSLSAPKILRGLSASITGRFGVDYRDPVTSSETIPRAIPQNAKEVRADVGYEF